MVCAKGVVCDVLWASGCIGKTTLVLAASTEGPAAAGCTTVTPWLFGGLDLQQQQQQQQMTMMMTKTRQPLITAPLPTSDMSCHQAKTPEYSETEKTFTSLLTNVS